MVKLIKKEVVSSLDPVRRYRIAFEFQIWELRLGFRSAVNLLQVIQSRKVYKSFTSHVFVVGTVAAEVGLTALLVQR